MIRRAVRALLILPLAGLFALSVRQYLGFESYGRYKAARSADSGRPAERGEGEAHLLRAAGRLAHPLFEKELGRLYLEKAQAADRAGDAETRDGLLDKAAAAVSAGIRLNPVDSWAYFELGKIYMFWNAPLLTYADKGRRLMRRALELNPAHDFLNLNVLYYHLTQWDMLAPDEKAFVYERLERKWREKPAFLRALRRQWKSQAKTADGLQAILEANPPLWDLIRGDFR